MPPYRTRRNAPPVPEHHANATGSLPLHGYPGSHPGGEYMTQRTAVQHQQVESSQDQEVDHIPRPRNAFMLWKSNWMQNKQELKKHLYGNHSNPGESHVGKVAGRVWKQLVATEKKKWFDEAEEEKRRHAAAYPNYRYEPRRTITSRVPRLHARSTKQKKVLEDDDDESASETEGAGKSRHNRTAGVIERRRPRREYGRILKVEVLEDAKLTTKRKADGWRSALIRDCYESEEEEEDGNESDDTAKESNSPATASEQSRPQDTSTKAQGSGETSTNYTADPSHGLYMPVPTYGNGRGSIQEFDASCLPIVRSSGVNDNIQSVEASILGIHQAHNQMNQAGTYHNPPHGQIFSHHDLAFNTARFGTPAAAGGLLQLCSDSHNLLAEQRHPYLAGQEGRM